MPKKVKIALVTGGAGFIGSNLVRELLRRRWSVRVLDDFSTGRRENLAEVHNRIVVVRGDIRKPAVCRKAVAGARAVFHLAALPSVIRSVGDPAAANDVNVNGTLNLLLAARDEKVKAFVYSSSSSAYGDTPRLPKTESMREMPLSPYAVSKLAAEKYCRVFCQLYGLRTVALRYFNVYGPRQDPGSEYAAVIPKFISLMLAGERPVVYGDGGQTRDFTFIEDVVAANLRAAASTDAAGEAVNIGAGRRVSLLQLVKVLNRILGTDLKPLLADPRPGDVRHSLASIALARRLIGYNPGYTLLKGLEKTVAFFRQ